MRSLTLLALTLLALIGAAEISTLSADTEVRIAPAPVAKKGDKDDDGGKDDEDAVPNRAAALREVRHRELDRTALVRSASRAHVAR